MLDQGIVLPAFVVGGLALMRRQPLGYWLAPTMLGFGVAMTVALVGMAVSVEAKGTARPPLVALVAMWLLTAGGLPLPGEKRPSGGRS